MADIRMITSIKDVELEMMNAYYRAQNLIIRAFSMLGEKCVIEARDRPQENSWFDQSGNLRSSIGYVVVCEGEIIHYSDFNQVKQGSEGTLEGKELAKELAKNHIKGYALIVVAGMNYAEYVESLDNKVVLASAELFAEKELPNMMKKLKEQIAR